MHPSKASEILEAVIKIIGGTSAIEQHGLHLGVLLKDLAPMADTLPHMLTLAFKALCCGVNMDLLFRV